MKRIISSVLLFLSLLMGGCKKEDNPQATNDHGSITGRVTESSNGTGIVSVTISTQPPTSNVLTDASGNYAISSVSPGSYTVNAVKTGYDPLSTIVEVTSNGSVRADFALILTSDNSSVIMPLKIGNWWNYGDGKSEIDYSFTHNGITFFHLPDAQLGYSGQYLFNLESSSGKLFRVFPKNPSIGDAWKFEDADTAYRRIIRIETITVPAGTFQCFVEKMDNYSELWYWAINVGSIKGDGVELQGYYIAP